jgi:hypothetical protein
MDQREPFAVEASVTYSGAWGERTVRYWHQTPYYWRAEQDGSLILITCDDGGISHDEAAWPIRWLHVPEGVCSQAGSRPVSGGQAVTVLGRSAARYDLDPRGTMTVDAETGFVLELHAVNAAGEERHLVSTAFTVPDALDPALFGEETLNTSWEGFYSGYLIPGSTLGQ